MLHRDLFPYALHAPKYSSVLTLVSLMTLGTYLILTTTLCSSSSAVYYEVSDYAQVKKIDVHVHVRTQRPAFAQQAIQDEFQLVNIAVDGAGTWKAIRDQWRYIKQQKEAFPDRYQMVTAFSVEGFHEPHWEKRTISWLDSCFAAGAVGVKVWKNIGMSLMDTDSTSVMLDDYRFDPIFAHIIERGKLVIGHLGEPLNCWLPLSEMTTTNDSSYFSRNPQYHMFRHPHLPSYHAQMEARDARLDRHPSIQFAGAHMASIEWNVDTLAAWLDTYPHATIDLAARMGQIFYQTIHAHDKVRAFFIKYQDQLMYATDMGDRMTSSPEDLGRRMHETWLRDWTYFVSDQPMSSDLVRESFSGIRLPREAVDQIFYHTAARFFEFGDDDP